MIDFDFIRTIQKVITFVKSGVCYVYCLCIGFLMSGVSMFDVMPSEKTLPT